jgi:twinkle protein
MTPAERMVAEVRQTSRIRCPQCADERKKNNPTLSITVEPDKTLYQCHHCNWHGAIHPEPIKDYRPLLNTPHPLAPSNHKVTHIPTQLQHDTGQIQAFFKARGVVIDNLSQLPPMQTGTKYFHGAGQLPCIGFTYGSKEQPTAIKWRALDRKLFTQDGTAAEFYGQAQLDPEDTRLIIVEGEADVIALASVGIRAVSCPNGAPMKVSNRRVRPEDDKKFGFVWEGRDLHERAERVLLATDYDEAGEALREELARRIDRAKCWQVTYPEGCKDVTDVLALHGAEAVQQLIEGAEPMPLAGVYSASDYEAELMEYYRTGHGTGETTGIAAVDDLFTIKEGQLSVVTGLPSSGKSEFIDQIMVNMAREKSWKFAVASFENPPAIHIAKLAEKIVGKPFYEGATPRMQEHELHTAKAFINDHFVFLESKEEHPATITSIIDRTKQAISLTGPSRPSCGSECAVW